MDISRLAQDVLAFAGEKGLMSEDWGERERNLQTLLRQIGQETLQQAADSNPRRGYEGSSRVCSCGEEQRFVQHRSRTIETLFGSLNYTRAYYHCPACGQGSHPFDQTQGLSSRQASVGLAQALVELAESMPFRQAADKLQKLLGVELSASTVNRISREVGSAAAVMEQEAADQVEADRHGVLALEAGRLYNYADGAMVHRLDGWHEVKALQCRWQDKKGQWHARHLCRNEEAESFAKLAWACMHVCGLDNARQSVLCGDGIPWIWNHLGPIADEAVQILDWYHAKEHLWKLAQSLHGEGTPRCQACAQSLEKLLWESRREELFAVLNKERSRLRSKARRSAIDELVGYLERHKSRIDYKKYREQGLLIGSGPIEGDCKNLIHARMKRGSPRWSKQGSQSMLSLRCCHANNEQHLLWNRKPLLAA
jgi:hypothetical protein